MSTLSSTSTYAQVLAAYDDNASYEEDASATKAAAFITACRFLARYAKRATHGGRGAEEIEFSPETLQAERLAAQRWLANQTQAAGGGVRFASFEDFRE